jgi:hypothetical protein
MCAQNNQELMMIVHASQRKWLYYIILMTVYMQIVIKKHPRVKTRYYNLK